MTARAFVSLSVRSRARVSPLVAFNLGTVTTTVLVRLASGDWPAFMPRLPF